LTLSSCNFEAAQGYFDEATKPEAQEKYSDAILSLDKAIKKESKIKTI
jgi:hypothetical protein